MLPYALAVAIIAVLAHGIPSGQFLHVLRIANARWFLLACLGSFAFWFFGDTVSLARLFTYFHVRTTFREMLSANTAQYFLQTINHVAGGTALALFMRRNKGVPIVSSGCSMMFLGLIDFLVMGLTGLAAAALVPGSLLASEWYYPAVLTGGICLFVWFWLRGRPSWKTLRRVYELPSLASFRSASISQYFRLMLIRAGVFTGEAFMLYIQLRSFGVRVPLIQVLAFEPAELFLSALPITPAGLGVLQAVLILGFHSYGSRATLLTMGLAISTMGIALRLPLGFGAAGSFAREAIRIRDTEPVGAAE
ncbi:MAG TPA: lysylphosphatidylglycerol synthase transmembrane domain-containing protein [Terriglobia bacterium]|nr:lysylphosphatidylglycerol synthase transmembrane domain-containing protein [Terriglobia bacterium]